jgi:hypothetical protein
VIKVNKLSKRALTIQSLKENSQLKNGDLAIFLNGTENSGIGAFL